jgi:multiple sugar transport system ATP-binding protein
MAAIKLNQVDKVYDNGTVAIRGLNLDVADGERVVLLGPSGCGKTTILRVLAGLEKPTSGRVFLGEKDVTHAEPAARDLAMVFQTPALYPHKTIRDNLAFALRLRRLPAGVIAERVAYAARTLGLDELLERKPAELSGGQRQRVALGRALVRQPAAFLLDEPLSNLDAQLRVQMRSEIKRLHQELRSTILYVTHDQEEAMVLGDRVAVLREGVVQQVGTPQNIYERPVNRFVAGFIGSPPMNFLACIPHLKGDTTVLECSGFSITAACCDMSAQSGPVLLGIRPHEITMVDAASADAVACVESVQSLGSEFAMQLRLASGTTLIVAAAAPPPVGSDVGVSFRRNALHFFDATSGASLRA